MAVAAKAIKFKKIACQYPMSLDVGAAIWALKRFGEIRFPGIGKATYDFWPTTDSPDGRMALQLESEGILPVGCGKSRFDHHPHSDFPGECSFTQVLKALSLRDDPKFSLLTKYVLWDDTREDMHGDELSFSDAEMPFALAPVFKKLPEVIWNRDATFPAVAQLEMKQALNWLWVALDAHIEDQVEFFSRAAYLYQKATKVDVKCVHFDRKLHLVCGRTSSQQFAAYARSGYADKPADVVVQQVEETGGVQIFTRAGTRLDMRSLVQRIRMLELKARGEVLDVSVKELIANGMHPLVPQWFVLLATGARATPMLLNGSSRNPGVEITKIPFHDIIDCVIEWMKDPSKYVSV